ncbi:MAG TPA: GntR family transcriptional regulator [Hyphomicrobiaceae bacterium]|nr:GntR family transcriptional regulator [Hyphomicrobiaceae bacterium]
MSQPQEDDSRPLYVQVRERLIDRIRSGAWKPGQLIPNEFEIAAEYGVSQGTARKAISELASEGLVVRRQGRGTFVVEHTPAHVLFRFFNLYDASGAPVIPDSRDWRRSVGRATAEERATLGLGEDAAVIRMVRTRTREGRPFIAETITLPEALFPGLANAPEVPNTLYDLFQKAYGVLMTRTSDRLSAVAADAETAATLGIAPGTPLLRIDRIGFALDDTPVEWRVSLCNLENAHYLARNK